MTSIKPNLKIMSKNKGVKYQLSETESEEDGAACVPNKDVKLTQGPNKKNPKRICRKPKAQCLSGQSSSRSQNKRARMPVKYSISSDSDDTSDKVLILKEKRDTADNMKKDQNTEQQSSSISKPAMAADVEPALNSSDNSPADKIPINTNSTANINDFGEELAELLSECDRLIEESEATFTSSISSPARCDVIDLVNTTPAVVVDLTDSPVPVLPNKAPEPTDTNTRVPECPICYEDLNKRQASVTPCGHYFCTQCIKMALVANKKCPTCRKKCLVSRLYPLYMSLN